MLASEPAKYEKPRRKHHYDRSDGNFGEKSKGERRKSGGGDKGHDGQNNAPTLSPAITETFGASRKGRTRERCRRSNPGTK